MTADARDVDAWERCIEFERRRSPAHAERINEMLAKEGLAKAGRAAAYGAQYDALKLRPWDWTPSWVSRGDIDKIIAEEKDESIRTAAVLLKRMLDAGLSQWEPDPLKALAQAKKKDAAA